MKKDHNLLSNEFLNETYNRLGYRDGSLLNAVYYPGKGTKEEEEWIDKGEWLSTASRIGAEKVFFVNNDPVIIFHNFPTVPTEKELLNTFLKAWCMARPRCLFLGLPGELRVYSLSRKPAKDLDEWKRIEPIEVVKNITEVAEKLHYFSREQIESGFADGYLGETIERADKRLIIDLKVVRKTLLSTGLPLKYAHALIGRSIFIRYLEDTNIITPVYFDKIASQDRDWSNILSTEPEKPLFMVDNSERRYDRVLKNKKFTYALFKQLRSDFNGDLFPQDENEETEVDQIHLDKIRGFLLGDTNFDQQKLFFWAYDFKIIPIELISNLYEVFYHTDKIDDAGTHYTPSVLVDYILSQLLPKERIYLNPIILDPACGSGIFLVKAFRRIIRYWVQKNGEMPSSYELQRIIRNQICGIEINPDAIQIAALSLYLALLHYQEPPDILAQINNKSVGGGPLPNLIWKEGEDYDSTADLVLFNTDAFGLTESEIDKLKHGERSQDKYLKLIKLRLPAKIKSFDIIVGNPPWGFKEGSTSAIKEAQKNVSNWNKALGWTIGDKEPSQAFIARTITLLKKSGEAGLLVSTGVLLKHRVKNNEFRDRLLGNTIIKTVVNFSHVRLRYFQKSVAPFAFIHFQNGSPDSMHLVQYWSAKKSSSFLQDDSLIFNLSDLHRIRQVDLMNDNSLWKTYWWGSHRDANFIKRLSLDTSLKQLCDDRNWVSGQGYTPGHAYPTTWLRDFLELPIEYFKRYGSIASPNLTSVPNLVHRQGIRELYDGWRILIKRGVTQKKGANGRIIARLENGRYCFRNSIHAIKVENAEEWERKVIIGILWSSLARYYYFLITSQWGMWHPEIHLDEILKLPVRLPRDKVLRERIIKLVDLLHNAPHCDSGNIFNGPNRDTFYDAIQIERDLDYAIFELFELTEAERDLVLDMCEFGLDFYYRSSSSVAAKSIERFPKIQGTIDDLPKMRNTEIGLEGYLYVFLSVWNSKLEKDGEFSWRVIKIGNSPMIAVVFSTKEKGASIRTDVIMDDGEEWKEILDRCSVALLRPVSKRVFLDGMVRAVTDTDIFIIKRNERRLWTRSMAREDAEATLLQAMNLYDIRTV